MKKFLLIFSTIVLAFTSCVKSPEDKANKVIEEYIKGCLYKPNTYEAVQTQVDSAFAPFADPAFHKSILKLHEKCEALQKCEDEIIKEQALVSEANSYLAIFNNCYTEYDRAEHERYKAERQKHTEYIQQLTENKENLTTQIKKSAEKIKAESQKKPTFIGYQVTHRYRANSNEGESFIEDFIFIFNKDLTEIEEAFNIEESEYRIVKELIDRLKESTEEE